MLFTSTQTIPDQFALLSPPDSNDAGLEEAIFGELSQNNREGVEFFSPEYFDFNKTRTFLLDKKITSKSALKDWLESHGATPFEEPWKLDPRAKSDFLYSCESLQKKIKHGEIKKGVPYSFLKAARSPTLEERAGILLAGLAQQEKSGGYLIAHWNKEGGIIALTPEILFIRKDQSFKTAALAGTLRRPDSYGEQGVPQKQISDWLANPKERAEHDWVVQGISESLMPYGSLTIAPISIKASGSLLHFETKIEAFQLNASSSQILESLHPTPALGAFPREAGLKWLKEENKRVPRSRYGAPFGITLPEQALEIYLVLIRGIEWSNHFCQMGAGAGVVEKSIPANEWQEVLLKWTSIAKSLNLKLEKGFDS